MKGKKFTAAEKHFEKKKQQYEKEIKSLKARLDDVHRAYYDMRFEREFYERENEKLKNWVERLLEYTELSEEDIRLACERDKRMSETADWLKRFGGMVKGV